MCNLMLMEGVKFSSNRCVYDDDDEKVILQTITGAQSNFFSVQDCC